LICEQPRKTAWGKFLGKNYLGEEIFDFLEDSAPLQSTKNILFDILWYFFERYLFLILLAAILSFSDSNNNKFLCHFNSYRP
jgi:hypothetical protein